jgi:hypothetical protein
MAEQTEVQRNLDALAADLKRLEGEYNMFFSGRLPRPPWETRNRVVALIKRYDRGYSMPTGDRFRFEQLQSRFQSLIELWDRGLRAREEGRPGPFAPPLPKAPAKKPHHPGGRVLSVTAFTDPVHEMDKLHTLYDSLMEARKQHGEDVVPFHKFAALVKSQVTKLRDEGSPEVAFRVAVKDGKVAFTVRPAKEKGARGSGGQGTSKKQDEKT